jgi:succinoglycan biosynthesis protein ExoM
LEHEQGAGHLPVSVICCTRRRMRLLKRCLESVLDQVQPPTELIVVENDTEPQSEGAVRSFQERADALGIQLHYLRETTIGISFARNTGIRAANSPYVAFIDDDECAQPDWLQHLHATAVKYDADVVCGPVQPLFEPECPPWVTKSKLFDRAGQPTGECRTGGYTGNILFSRDVLSWRLEPFDPVYALTGGEDSDFLSWLRERGAVVYWCQEARVMEWQGPERCRVAWQVKRGYRGGWGFARQSVHHQGRLRGSARVLWPLPLAIGKSFFTASGHLPNARAAGLVLARNLAGQAGKLGYFLGVMIEPYRDS